MYLAPPEGRRQVQCRPGGQAAERGGRAGEREEVEHARRRVCPPEIGRVEGRPGRGHVYEAQEGPDGGARYTASNHAWRRRAIRTTAAPVATAPHKAAHKGTGASGRSPDKTGSKRGARAKSAAPTTKAMSSLARAAILTGALGRRATVKRPGPIRADRASPFFVLATGPGGGGVEGSGTGRPE